VRTEPLEPRGPRVLRAQLALPVLLALTVLPVLLVPQAQLALLALTVLPVLLVLQAPMDPTELVEP